MLGNDSIAYLGRYREPVLWPSCLCWGGVIESGDLFVYAVRDCGGGPVGQLLFWRGLMTLRGEAVAAEVVSMGRLHWTFGLGKNARENWRQRVQLAWGVGRRGGGTSPCRVRRGCMGREAVVAARRQPTPSLVGFESVEGFECCVCGP